MSLPLHLRQPSFLPLSILQEKQNHAGSVAFRLPLRNTRVQCRLIGPRLRLRISFL